MKKMIKVFVMRTGNAILVAFCVWLAVDLPIRIFTLSETYLIGDFAGMGRNDWIVFSFLLPFIFAIVFAIYGMEKNEKNTYYKKPEEKQKLEEPAVKPYLKAVEKKKEKENLVSDTQEHINEILKEKAERGK